MRFIRELLSLQMKILYHTLHQNARTFSFSFSGSYTRRFLKTRHSCQLYTTGPGPPWRFNSKRVTGQVDGDSPRGNSRDSERHWRRDRPLDQKLRQKAQEIFNGWKRGSGTMHAQTCMVPLGNFHGWTSASAWLDFPKCMVPLPALHGWAEKPQSTGQNVTHIRQ